jgi:hypothetical protein
MAMFGRQYSAQHIFKHGAGGIRLPRHAQARRGVETNPANLTAPATMKNPAAATMHKVC